MTTPDFLREAALDELFPGGHAAAAEGRDAFREWLNANIDFACTDCGRACTLDELAVEYVRLADHPDTTEARVYCPEHAAAHPNATGD